MTISVSHKELDILSPAVKSFIFNEAETKFLQIPNDFSKVKEQIELKKGFTQNQRNILADEMERQYSFLSESEKINSLVWKNIQLLRQSNSYTLTTGQQIHIFLGPMYVPHKIMSAVANCIKLKEENPEYEFIPIFWMATEDHDFEEIRSVKLWNKEFVWNEEAGGATGELSCNNILPIIEQIRSSFNLKAEENEILTVFERFYSNSQNLSEATAKIVNHFYGQFGVIALDANKGVLKNFFKPFIIKELEEGFAYQSVKSFSEIIKSKGIETQIGARDTALFLFEKGKRERIDRIDKETFKLSPSGKLYSKQDLIELTENHPELFSPNVALRPLYEEVILPNLAYFGGAGEIAYWFQLKELFKQSDIPYPILMLRKMAVYLTDKLIHSWEELGFETKEILLSPGTFQEVMADKITGNSQYIRLENEFELFIQKICDTSYSIDPHSVKSIKTVSKDWKKNLKSHFDNLAQKITEQNASRIRKIEKIRSVVYPDKKIQERELSFLEFKIREVNNKHIFQDTYLNSLEISVHTD
ncbi:MAG: bacillithiol biosynthesis cysteine-adding enzyme BshC [Bacteroidetes bacterium]|nr:bacillithiol biosynthesis cysteine-adding enzyme BshC [Bacteroidota bacterium]